jgi:endonuclease III related protein
MIAFRNRIESANSSRTAIHQCGNFTTAYLDFCGLASLSSVGAMQSHIAEGSEAQGPIMNACSNQEGASRSSAAALSSYFATLSQALGPMRWWPARTPFEVIVGAILTQSTAWSNVEMAIANLRRERLLTPRALACVSTQRLAELVRPSGYFRQKAKKLKAFVRFLRAEYGGSLARMFRTPTPELREQLLGVYGIGRETADSILLYAGGHAIFVVDAYTHRILSRHRLAGAKQEYEATRSLFESGLPRDARLYNEFHALLVNVGKNWCRRHEPHCAECPLKIYLPPDSIRQYRGANFVRLPAELPS